MQERHRTTNLDGARRLWAGRFRAVLSTHSKAEAGYPFGSVVPYCLDTTGQPLLLLSHLAQHTRNLIEDPRCALTLADSGDGDLQQNDRLTGIGDCTPIPTEDIPAAHRYFRYYPASENYFKKLGFRFYRLMARRFHYNGGFATARWAGSEHILRPSPFDRYQESELIREIEQRYSSLLANHLPQDLEAPEALVPAGIDPNGIDLRRGTRLTRIHFDHPLNDPVAVHGHLATLS